MNIMDQPDDLSETGDDFSGLIGDGSSPEERREVMPAKGIEGYVLYGDKAGVVIHPHHFVQHILGAEGVTAEQLVEGPANPVLRLPELVPDFFIRDEPEDGF